MSELLPCPFCGGEDVSVSAGYWDALGARYEVGCDNPQCVVHPYSDLYPTEAEAIEAWNKRAAYEMDGWFYLPKPKEPIVEVTETTNTWDGTKVRTDLFYQVREQAVINWARELDENIIKRICEVWNTRAERTCRMQLTNLSSGSMYHDVWLCRACGEQVEQHTFMGKSAPPNYCPNCGCKVVSE